MRAVREAQPIRSRAKAKMHENRRAESTPFAELTPERTRQTVHPDVHAAGAPGGLTGSNVGRGEPEISELQNAMGNGDSDVAEARNQRNQPPRFRHAGGAMGGTPAGKRTGGG